MDGGCQEQPAAWTRGAKQGNKATAKCKTAAAVLTVWAARGREQQERQHTAHALCDSMH